MEIKSRILIAFLLLGTGFSLVAQDCPLEEEQVQAALQQHVEYLASDELEGRLTGTEGERLAHTYISGQFREMGIAPLQDDGSYLQPFPVNAQVAIDPQTRLAADGKNLRTGADFFPLVYSANGSLAGVSMIDAGYGISAPELKHDDYAVEVDRAGKAFLINYSSPDGVHPHSRFLKYHDLKDRLILAKEKGAAAVIVYNPDPHLRDPRPDFRRIQSIDIPVVFVVNAHNDIFRALPGIDTLRVYMQETQRTGHNVVGFIDNGAAHTVVIGAHYDHLGMGIEGSLDPDSHAIHNGADDNASGTAAMIEMARYLAGLEEQQNNYLFIAFSGEEMGLLGSKYFVEHSPVAVDQMNYMLNMDMVGRLETGKGLGINGTGTSSAWDAILDEIDADHWPIKRRASGIGPSDHTSFYLKDMPVLHFFSGTHEDYHRPSDDADKVNYEGMAQILCLMARLIKRTNAGERLDFTPTGEENTEEAPRFTVTLGIMPDYLYDGDGMRIDGLREDKPAEKAGLKKGDIVIQMGDIKVRDMMSYMQGLSMFKKGDTTTVKVRRGEEEVEVEGEF